ncbi:hypothetical protein [Novosphingobium sp. SG720]|uniref:hypothetical protein n=1 Tax=Novosphingobium sp. SG720 TaxID=2586998 RepID=UPI00144847C9|nr:hypothetical protein [Novosphingobium sp. SG720]NKJ43687.1 hypothetical protein [Novosphingobium sp. SG720]
MADSLEEQVGTLVVPLIREISACLPTEDSMAKTVQFDLARAGATATRWQIQVRRLADGGANG